MDINWLGSMLWFMLALMTLLMVMMMIFAWRKSRSEFDKWKDFLKQKRKMHLDASHFMYQKGQYLILSGDKHEPAVKLGKLVGRITDPRCYEFFFKKRFRTRWLIVPPHMVNDTLGEDITILGRSLKKMNGLIYVPVPTEEMADMINDVMKQVNEYIAALTEEELSNEMAQQAYLSTLSAANAPQKRPEVYREDVTPGGGAEENE